ncbi:MAG: hypothetical protein JWN34_4590 [Bryobacterales bacterium]|nr:hypothetical protein [Bryobacterales bacterium]
MRQPVIEVIEDLATPPLHMAAWATCCGAGWRFGHASHAGVESQFWKRDLESDEAFDAIWKLAQPRCEALAGGPLRVLRVYANGHTYGLGGAVHRDADRAGAFTLLYYPNPEWKQEWDGETVYYDEGEEVALAVRVRPNRAVFFDSRIPHVGRPPSRSCSALRVTVAWKLELSGEAVDAEVPQEDKSPEAAEKIYTHLIEPKVVLAAVHERLEQLARSISIPGVRPGQAPIAERYGETARQDVIKRLAKETVEAKTPRGSIVTTTHVTLEDSGALRVEIRATHLPDLPDPTPQGPFLRLRVNAETAELAGIQIDEASALTASHLKTQVLDWLNNAYAFPVPSSMVEKEAEAIARLAGGGIDEYRALAQRRIRLGLLFAEIARRRRIQSMSPAELENLVVESLLVSASVEERDASPAELRELAAD